MQLTNCENYQEPLISPTKFARLLGMHYNTVKLWQKNGQIKFVMLPSGRWRIPQSEVDKFTAVSPDQDDGLAQM